MSTEKKLTAMQELINYLKQNFYLTDESFEFFNSQLEKEKQQIIEAYKTGVIGTLLSEDYYNETFKN